MKQLFISLTITATALIQSLNCSAYDPKALSLSFSEAYDSITGKVGVKLGDETVLMPKFDDVKFDYHIWQCPSFYSDNPLDHSNGIFAYKENGKWGISSLLFKLTEPIYDDVILFQNPRDMAVVTVQGKKGVVGLSGTEIIPIIYDDVSEVLGVDKSSSWVDHRRPFFIVRKDGQKHVFNVYGLEIADAYDDTYLLISDTKKRDDKMQKEFDKLYKLEDKFRSNKSNKTIIDSLYTNYVNATREYTGQPDSTTLRIKKREDGRYLLQKGLYFELLPEGYEYKTVNCGFYFNKIKDVTYMFGKDGKWGIKTISGKVLLEPEYDDIRGQNCMIWKVTKDGRTGMTTVFGELIMPCQYDNVSYEVNASYAIGYNKKEADYYYSGKETYPRGEIIAHSEKQYYKLIDDIVAKQQKRPEHLAIESSEAIKAEEEYAANTEGNVGTYYTLNGQRGVITDYGTDLLPLIKSSAKDVLERNPYSLVGMARYIITGGGKENERDSEGIVRDLPAIVEYAREEGYGNSEFVKNLETEISEAEKSIQRYAEWQRKQREKEEREERVRHLNETLDRISNSLVNTLTTAAQTIGASQAASSSYASATSGNSSSHKTSNKATGNGFKLSSRQAYLNDKSTYEKYDTMLAAYFAGNRTASVAEKEQWQKAMKALRTKWENSGESFPHSSNEDR